MTAMITTTNKEKIMRWVNERGGVPALFHDPEDVDSLGSLTIAFPDSGFDEDAVEVTWDAFFERLNDEHLALKYQETNEDGDISYEWKLVPHETSPI